MPYLQYRPSGLLEDYIDAYWVRRTDEAAGFPGRTDEATGSPGRRVYADGCADIILNTGGIIAWFSPTARAGDTIPLHPGKMYLGGTMTEYAVVTAAAGCILTGIRFRPGGFYALYGQPMAPAVDTLLEFTDHPLQLLMEKEETFPSRLDTYFSAKKYPSPDPPAHPQKARHDFISIYKVIYLSKGQISVEALSKECHMSNRTMERVFKENVGIPPKEFIRIVRFQEVLRRLRQGDMAAFTKDPGQDDQTADRHAGQAAPRESLLRIAFELGYHDHAHLTNEFKRYAGILPSELSRFYKTGMAFGEYF